MTDTPDWQEIYEGTPHTRDRDQELVAVSRETLRLAISTMQKSQERDAYHNIAAAVCEAVAALKCDQSALAAAEARGREVMRAGAVELAKTFWPAPAFVETPAQSYEQCRANAGRNISEAILAITPSPDWVAVKREGTYTHRKGGVYDSLGIALVQTDVPLTDMDEVVVYRGHKDGTLWARRAVEFEDGRFTRAMLAQAGKEG